MCNFLSFVVTANDIYTFDNSNSHTDIIEHHRLADDPTKILKVEITPPASNLAAPASKWSYAIDQDILPAWHTDNPDATEKRVRRAVSSWMRVRPWWKRTAGIIAEYKSIPWLKPDGNPDPSWKLFTAPTLAAARDAAGDTARYVAGDIAWAAAWAAVWAAAVAAARNVVWAAAGDTARAAARVAAEDTARYVAGDIAWAAAWAAAGDIAGDALMRGVCGDLQIDQAHRDHIAARVNVWRKGYCLLCDVNGELYVYAARTQEAQS